MNTNKLVLSFFVALALAGCDDGNSSEDNGSEGQATDSGDTSDAIEINPDEIAAAALDYQSLQMVNDEPFASQHGLADTVNVWVGAEHVQSYENLDGFEPGTLLVKEQLDADGQFLNVTVMYKGSEGYAPDAGDWWFGLVAPDGSVTVGGQPQACLDCHSGVADTDYVFGL